MTGPTCWDCAQPVPIPDGVNYCHPCYCARAITPGRWPTVERHPTGIVSVSGMVIDATGERLVTLRIVPDGDTPGDPGEEWYRYVARIGARPV